VDFLEKALFVKLFVALLAVVAVDKLVDLFALLSCFL
jgi:hypothetical protein